MRGGFRLYYLGQAKKAAERVQALEDQLRVEKEENQGIKDASKLRGDDLMNCFIKREQDHRKTMLVLDKQLRERDLRI